MLAGGEDVLREGSDDQEPENLCSRVKLDWCSIQIRKGQMMIGPAVSQLVYLLDEAFQGTEREWHALGTNLRSTTAEDWLWVPPDGVRSIRDIVIHIGGAKLMYHNHAFGNGQLTWDDPRLCGPDGLSSLDLALSWLKLGHEQLRASLVALFDADLLIERKTPAGRLKETRWIIATMIEHDLYHAGEINHIRALHQHNDL